MSGTVGGCWGVTIQYRHTLAVTRKPCIVSHRLMLQTPVVPHGEHARCPFHPALNAWIVGDKLIEPVEYHIAFPRGEPFDVRCEARVNEQQGSTGFRVRYNHRMRCAGVGLVFA